MNALQTAFDFYGDTDYSNESFIAGQSNWMAYAHIQAWKSWQKPITIIIGPKESGKTHLLHILAELAQADIIDLSNWNNHTLQQLKQQSNIPILIDNTQQILKHTSHQETLFHLIEYILRMGIPLVLCGEQVPTQWSITLPDLLSRLELAVHVTIEPLQEQMAASLLSKRLTDYTINPPHPFIAKLARLLFKYGNRSYSSVGASAYILAQLWHQKRCQPTFESAKAAFIENHIINQ